MNASIQGGDYRKIYHELTKRLAYAYIASSADNLGLIMNDPGEAEVPLFREEISCIQKRGDAFRRQKGPGYPRKRYNPI